MQVARHIPAHVVREIAVVAECDPRSVQRRAAGRPIRGMVVVRIDRELAARGITPPVSPRKDRTP